MRLQIVEIRFPKAAHLIATKQSTCTWYRSKCNCKRLRTNPPPVCLLCMGQQHLPSAFLTHFWLCSGYCIRVRMYVPLSHCPLNCILSSTCHCCCIHSSYTMCFEHTTVVGLDSPWASPMVVPRSRLLSTNAPHYSAVILGSAVTQINSNIYLWTQHTPTKGQ